MQRLRLAETEHRGRGEGGVAGRACAGRTDGGTRSGGGEQPGHLPHAPLGPGSGPRTRLRGRMETRSPWEWKWGRLRGRRRRKAVLAGRISGYAREQMGRGSQGSCIVGRAQREDGRGSGWSARSPAGVWSCGWRWSGVLARGTAPRRAGSVGDGGGGQQGHLWKPFVPTPRWEAPPLFRIQHPQT